MIKRSKEERVIRTGGVGEPRFRQMQKETGRVQTTVCGKVRDEERKVYYSFGGVRRKGCYSAQGRGREKGGLKKNAVEDKGKVWGYLPLGMGKGRSAAWGR